MIVDAFGLIFRAYYALIRNPLTTSDGFSTSAIMGFWSMIFRGLKELNPDEMIITLDSPGPSFRKEMFNAYKANRDAPPEDLKEQITYIVNMIKNMDISYMMAPGFEADDIIAYLARRYSKENYEVFIYSSDKDLAQLVNEKVKMTHPEKGMMGFKILDTDGVVEKFGIKPEQMVDYLALIGDTSDNIPGVKGIGPKSAVKLFQYGKNLEGIYANVGLIKPDGVKKKLIENKESAFLSRELVVLNDKIDEKYFNKKDMVFSNESIQFMMDTFHQLELNNLLKNEIFANYTPSNDVVVEEHKEEFNEKETAYELILKKEKLLKIIERIQSQKWFILDTETTSKNFMKAEIIGFSLALKEKEAYYIPLVEGKGTNFTKEDFFNLMIPILQDENIRKIGQNIKYDYKVLLKYTTINGIYFDTMIAAFILEPDEKRYNMDFLATKFLQYKTIHYKDIVDDKKGETLLNLDINLVKNYACEDADITLRLYQVLKPLLEKNYLHKVFYNIEMKTLKVLAQMEMDGIHLDLHKLREIQVDFEDELAKLENEIHKEVGLSFNISSPSQVGEVLFEKLGLPVIKKTKTGYSTDEYVLERLKDHSVVASNILKYRKYNKLLTTYINGLPKHLINGKIHTTFNQYGAATGRLSSTSPNLQNIPIREELGRLIRTCFIPSPGCVLVSADYSQIELRLMAHFSQDENLMKAFQNDMDVHKFTASLIFGLAEDQIHDFHRGVAKTINFGIIYGMGPFKLSRELGISHYDAKEFISKYFNIFSGVKHFIENTHQKAAQEELVTTLLGRKRLLKNINSKNKNLKAADERVAVNTIFQGTNADIMKKLMIKVAPQLEQYKTKMLLQIHDELIFEVSENKVDLFINYIKNEMENIISLNIPLKVSINSGKNWGILK